MTLHRGSRESRPQLMARVAQTAIDSLHHTLLKAREPTPDMERDYDKAYAFWLSMWRETFAAVDPSIQVHSDVFVRHREISAVFSHDEVVGLIMYDFRNLRVRAHRDMSHFQHFPSDVIDALHARGHEEVMLMGQLTVHPKWRKKMVGPFMSDLLVGLSVKRFLESNASVMIAFTRNDRGTQDLGYRFGAVPLRVGHEAYGIASDVIAFYRDRVRDCPLPGLPAVIDRLWFGTSVPARFSNLPKALESAPENDVVQLSGIGRRR